MAGFVGSRLAAALVERGEAVRGIDNFLAGFKENVPPGVEFVEADLRDLDAMHAACRGVEMVYHQAARRSVAKSVDDPLLTDECNTRGTLNLLIAAHDAGVRRVVYASSSSVYGDPPEPLRREDQPAAPISPYAVSKLAGENYCRAFTAIHGLSTVSLRYFNVFGPGQHRESRYALLFPAFVEALVQGRPPQV
ncbi:MAG: NAD-dependent epimerase/dehydratase family protein, partial [Actinomycetota bacterium]